jgi:hypothetical protein
LVDLKTSRAGGWKSLAIVGCSMESPGLLGCRGFVDYSPLISCEGVRERHLSSFNTH